MYFVSSRADVSMDVGDEESSILQVSSSSSSSSSSSAETAEELYAEDAYRYLAEREEKNKPKPR